MEKISAHISYLEATKSNTASRRGIDNTPDERNIKNMRRVAEDCFEPLREHFGKAIGISSFFRCEELNKAIGGAKYSQHRAGADRSGYEAAAIDIDADMYNNGITNADIFNFLDSKKDELDYDQLIWEFGTDENPAWIHLSKRAGNNRKRNLKAMKVNGKTTYIVI